MISVLRRLICFLKLKIYGLYSKWLPVSRIRVKPNACFFLLIWNIFLLSCHQDYLSLMKERGTYLRSRHLQYLLAFSYWPLITNRTGNNIYEMRSYRLKPGTMIEWGNNWARAINFRRSDEAPFAGFFSQIGRLYNVHHIWCKFINIFWFFFHFVYNQTFGLDRSYRLRIATASQGEPWSLMALSRLGRMRCIHCAPDQGHALSHPGAHRILADTVNHIQKTAHTQTHTIIVALHLHPTSDRYQPIKLSEKICRFTWIRNVYIYIFFLNNLLYCSTPSVWSIKWIC